MHNVFLIGFMGVGKSTIARMLAKELQAELIEMDETIEAETGKSINQIFERYGETYFRELESGLIERIAKKGDMVVSCGGGAVLRPENVQKMKESGTIVFLTATAETIYERVRNSTNRPLLNGNMNVEYIRGLMDKRRDAYQSAADIVIITDGKGREEVLKEILCKF